MKPFSTAVFLAFLYLQFAHAEPEIFTLWPEGDMPGPAPFVDGVERDLTKPDDRLIASRRIIKLGHVSEPQAHIYLPPKDKANGSAVVVCPGGGFSLLAWDLEGTEVAKWLNSLGTAAVVVKYRVPTRQHGEELTDGPVPSPKKSLGPVMDTQRAISIVRANATKWRLNPKRIGVLGFSAGGQTAAQAALASGIRTYDVRDEYDQYPCAADFAMLIYPGGLADKETGALHPHVKVNKTSPPFFFAHAADDRVTCLSSTALFTALKLADVPAEMHIYASGGHGYGLRQTEEPVTKWISPAGEWLSRLYPDAQLSDSYVTAWREGNPLPHANIETLDRAYDLQRDWVSRTLDEAGIGGVKGGVVSPGGQKAFAITEPVGAILRASGKYKSGDTPEISLQKFPGLKLETEIGFVVGKTIDRELDDIEEFKKHVSGIFPVIELISGDWEKPNGKLTAADLAAINVTAAGYITGKPIDPHSIDPCNVSLSLTLGDKELHTATGADCWKGPWETGFWLSKFATRQGVVLQPGQVIICGALGKIQDAETGSYHYDAGDLGGIEFSVVE